MPSKNPLLKFDFVLSSEKTLAKSTLSNYKSTLNRLTTASIFEHERDETKPVIRTKDHLKQYPETVLFLIKEHISKKTDKSVTLAAIFYIIGRQEETHPYVTEFRKIYYTPKYLQSIAEKTQILQSAKVDVVCCQTKVPTEKAIRVEHEGVSVCEECWT